MTRLKKIMVVDDEAGIRNLLFDVLSSEGFKVLREQLLILPSFGVCRGHIPFFEPCNS